MLPLRPHSAPDGEITAQPPAAAGPRLAAMWLPVGVLRPLVAGAARLGLAEFVAARSTSLLTARTQCRQLVLPGDEAEVFLIRLRPQRVAGVVGLTLGIPL